MKLWTILIVVFVIDNLFNDVLPYETPTHSLISDQALDRSILVSDPELLAEIGIAGDTESAGFPSEVPVDEDNSSPEETIFLLDASIRRIITGGSVLEDQSLRSPFHFYDATAGGRGLTIGYSPFAYSFTGSPDWILDPQLTGHRIESWFQQFSYADSLRYFYQALTEPLSAFRDVNYGLLFRGLGHVIHHLQDMAQPQHVRNDQHCEKAASFLCSLSDNPSHYEKYTDTERGRVLDSVGQYPVPTFATAREFWINSKQTGIAEFTQNNFVSQGSNFELDSLGRLSTNKRYPLPLPFQDNTTLSFNFLSLLQEVISDSGKITTVMQGLDCNLPLVCEMDFIASNVIDYGSGQSVNPRASSISMLDDELRIRDLRKGITPTFNRLNFHAAYPYLLPRAIAYSAGMINHFFRARLQVEDAIEKTDGTLNITVRNMSRADGVLRDGQFELYYDAIDGQRKPANGLYLSNGSLPVAVGDSVELSAVAPEDVDASLDMPYMLIFNAAEGSIGVEPAIAAIQLDIPVAGQVDRLSTGAGNCPDRIYGVSIVFPEQPADNGQIQLKGQDSGAEFDFTSIPTGEGIFRFGALWTHKTDTYAGGYRYEVTYRYPASTADPCLGMPLGSWQQDEPVRAIEAEN